MFEIKGFDNDDYDSFHKEISTYSMSSNAPTLYIIGAVVLLVLLIACCCRCCCRRESRGQVLTPAPVNVQVHSAAPYPQQQYTATYPAQLVTTYPVQGAPVAYPAASAYPYPTSGMPVPSQQGPVVTPYPPANYAAYPSAPSAPEVNAVFFGIAPPGWNTQAMPPSYEQAVCAKPPPHNPYASH